MGKVTCQVSMSLDGFIAGPNVRVGNGMGDDGDRLRRPASGPSVSATAMARFSSTTGEPVRRASSSYNAAICAQSHGISACNEAMAACRT